MNQHRGALTAQIARKRKERDDSSSSLFLPGKKDSNISHVSSRGKSVPPPTHSFFPVANTTSSVLLKKKPQLQKQQQEQAVEPVPASANNQLLAGYMAYEFLTKGSLLGQTFDPARADQAGGLSYSLSGELEKKKMPPPPLKNWNGGGSGAGAGERAVVEKRIYDEVATLLKADGAHIPGIVNPTQLARWIQMRP